MLDANLKHQLQTYLERLTQPIEIVASLDDSDASREMLALLQDIATLVAADHAARAAQRRRAQAVVRASTAPGERHEHPLRRHSDGP